MVDEIVDSFELKPVIVGAVISIILILILPMGILHMLWVIVGSAIAGFLTENSTKYALIYGAIIGLISSFFMLTAFTIPIYIILGIFGAFMGKIIQTKLNT
jgi:hypothetical protein